MTHGWRSLLFIAANDHARIRKVAERGADAVILDLEDAVPAAHKSSALDGLADAVRSLSDRRCSVVVRINAEWRRALAELPVAVRQDVAAIMIPKVEQGVRLRVITEIIEDLAAEAALPSPPGVIALIETPGGLADIASIAAVPGVIGLAFGTEDFALALGVPPVFAALDFPCRTIALAAAQHGLMALGLPVSIATIADQRAWRRGVQAGRAVGMTGALCVHPSQIVAANDGFAPSPEEIENARNVLEAWEGSGRHGVIQFDGKMIDRPVVRAAQRVMQRAAKAKETME